MSMNENSTENERRNKVILEYLPEIKKIAKKVSYDYWPGNRGERGDLINEGVLGLMKAMKKFDPKKNCLLRTYANKRIKGSMQDYLEKKEHDLGMQLEPSMYMSLHSTYNPFFEADNRLMLGRVGSRKNILDSNEWEILYLFYIKEISDTRIGKIMGYSGGGINQKRFKALKKMKHIVEK